MDDVKSRFPVGMQLESILRLSSPVEMNDLLEKALLNPLQDFFDRPGKKIRNQVVEVGYLLNGSRRDLEAEGAVLTELSETERALCDGCADVLEAIHAGSLVVDDIQDGSKVRRGQPALHLRYGVPVALNVGNWLYFWPMLKIKNLGLPSERELQFYRLCHDALLRAHFGQAIDVGVAIDTLSQDRIPAVCMASLELKSGALMALAMTLGGTLGGASLDRIQVLEKFGHRFGVSLQMFDDLGNLRLKDAKRLEDLLLKRPSWIWAVAAKTCSEKVFQEFVSAVNRLPDDSFLIRWLELHGMVQVAKEQAHDYLSSSFQELEFSLDMNPQDQKALGILKQLGERLSQSYG